MLVLPHIQIKNRLTGEKQFYRLDQDKIVIGRDVSNYIILDAKAISRRHSEILHEGGQYFLRDLKSNNGTFLNEKKIAPQEKFLLRSGDLIRLEDYDLHFEIPSQDSADDLHETTDTDLLEIKMIKKLLKTVDRQSAPTLEVMEGPQAGSRFSLPERNQKIIIGRDPACEFRIDSDVISRKHARIEKHLDTVILSDLDSKNGTHVNQTKLEKSEEKKLQDGDIIHLGPLRLVFRNPQELAFELDPPKMQVAPQEASKPEVIKSKEPELKVTVSHESSQELLASPRASLRKKKKDSQPELEEESPIPEEMPKEKFSLSWTEIIALAIGLVVLMGSLWGIIKILKF